MIHSPHVTKFIGDFEMGDKLCLEDEAAFKLSQDGAKQSSQAPLVPPRH